MKKAVYLCSLLILPLVLFMNAFLFSGCESAEGLDGLTLSPSSATLSPGSSNSVVFVATLNVTNSLAYPLEWSVSDGSLGSISASSGNTAVYTSTGRNGNNVIRARDQYGNQGVAAVTQTSVSYVLTLSASPSSLTATQTACTVTVTGGTPPYRWSVGNTALGTVSGSGSSVMYSSLQDGSNVIIVSDDYGVSASIAITRTGSSSSTSGGPTPGG